MASNDIRQAVDSFCMQCRNCSCRGEDFMFRSREQILGFVDLCPNELCELYEVRPRSGRT